MDPTVVENQARDANNSWIQFITNNKRKLWFLGFILRLIASSTNLQAYDYVKYRIPISKELNNGSGLYSDINYNQMPLYPYLSALMYFIFGNQNDVLTAVLLRFPITVADSIIPIVIYQLGIKLNKKQQGTMASIIYALNPMSLIEISVASFHSIGTLFLLLSIYYLLDNKFALSGVYVSLGFFTSEFPLIALGASFVYLRNNLIDFSKQIIGFLSTSTTVLLLVLIPSDTSIQTMYSSLERHPIYKGTIRGVVSELYEFLHNNFGVQEEIYYEIWLVLFLAFSVLPLILILRNSTEVVIFDVIIMQMTLLSIFFTANHTKHIFWIFPWLSFWACVYGGRIRYSIILITITYFIRRYVQDYHNEYVWISTILLGFTGFWIISISLRHLIDKRDTDP
ncbi:MAG: hypothetical protein ACXAC2_12565 [Candidatus Kariarchaeaceae archaeon]|jgi:4-amino-4-deoxy-L-arabinose transferase-like glycosyltransferase